MGAILVLSSLIIVCGFIAYTGDLLGRRLGKRRLSVFGLRPRHTAILCTVLTGMFIAATTLGVLMGVSAGVRLAITRGEALVRQNQQYRRERDRLVATRQRLESEIAPMRRRNQELADSNRAIQSKNQSLVAQNRELTRKVAELSASHQALTTEVGELRGARKRLQRENRTLVTANRDLVQAKRSAVAGLNMSRVELKRVRARLDEGNRQLTGMALDLEQSRKDLARSQQLVAERQKELDELQFQTERLALLDVTVEDGDELARVTVPAGTPPEEIREKVEALMDRAGQVARERGAKPSAEHPEGAYLVPGRWKKAFGPLVDWPRAMEPRLVELIVDTVAANRGDDPVVLRAQAVGNTVEGDPVPIDIGLYRNRFAFHQGEEIAATIIDPAETPGRILERLAAFLQGQVRNVSLKKIIPGPQNEVGEVRYDPLLEVAEKVKRLGVPARVGAVAARDTRAADPLEIQFYVVPAARATAPRAAQVADDARTR